MRIIKKLAQIHYINPFTPRPITGNESIRWVCQALDTLYLQEKVIYQGSISELEKLAQAAGTSARAGLLGLARYQYIKIEGDTFTPTDRYIDRFGSS